MPIGDGTCCEASSQSAPEQLRIEGVGREGVLLILTKILLDIEVEPIDGVSVRLVEVVEVEGPGTCPRGVVWPKGIPHKVGKLLALLYRREGIVGQHVVIHSTDGQQDLRSQRLALWYILLDLGACGK